MTWNRLKGIVWKKNIGGWNKHFNIPDDRYYPNYKPMKARTRKFTTMAGNWWTVLKNIENITTVEWWNCNGSGWSLFHWFGQTNCWFTKQLPKLDGYRIIDCKAERNVIVFILDFQPFSIIIPTLICTPCIANILSWFELQWTTNIIGNKHVHYVFLRFLFTGWTDNTRGHWCCWFNSPCKTYFDKLHCHCFFGFSKQETEFLTEYFKQIDVTYRNLFLL